MFSIVGFLFVWFCDQIKQKIIMLGPIIIIEVAIFRYFFVY